MRNSPKLMLYRQPTTDAAAKPLLLVTLYSLGTTVPVRPRTSARQTGESPSLQELVRVGSGLVGGPEKQHTSYLGMFAILPPKEGHGGSGTNGMPDHLQGSEYLVVLGFVTGTSQRKQLFRPATALKK
ncbi:hypothetical protein NDU88_003668 [Pleurodeles waltl]|uniref:Uncharacterized protein n=1 Tax=Pleurodeles waltl TaxID=8319 RepID=A0AAV7SGK7_PLEWA|nr:hypothetical protein NDU88_003668 [Pleurodeles waltl]